MTTVLTDRPDRTEAAEYYFTYIDQVSGGDICGILRSQLPDSLTLFDGVSEEQSLYRYAPDKWSIRQVVPAGNSINAARRSFADVYA
jgi:hypothetical protein